MASAFYYHGLTIEFDPVLHRLTVDGERVDLPEPFRESAARPLDKTTHAQLIEHAKQFIRSAWDLEARDSVRDEHVAEIKKGVVPWANWRQQRPTIRPLLYDADLRGADLKGANLANANMINAQLQGAHLENANLHEANLGGAVMTNAKLMEANLCRTDLYETDLHGADLQFANLQGTQLAKTQLDDARLNGCRVYGLAAWDLTVTDKTEQKDLRIYYRKLDDDDPSSPDADSYITVDDLSVAQFVYLLLHNRNVGTALNRIGSQLVLILGRFTPQERLDTLNNIRQWLREGHWVPVLFDFVKPTHRDVSETVKLLAGLSRFVISDITNPKSNPLELQVIIPDLGVPLLPIIQRGEQPFSMFDDFKKYDWVSRRIRSYRSSRDVANVLPRVIEDAMSIEKKLDKIRRRSFKVV
jgi:hypothetical protein